MILSRIIFVLIFTGGIAAGLFYIDHLNQQNAELRVINQSLADDMMRFADTIDDMRKQEKTRVYEQNRVTKENSKLKAELKKSVQEVAKNETQENKTSCLITSVNYDIIDGLLEQYRKNAERVSFAAGVSDGSDAVTRTAETR